MPNEKLLEVIKDDIKNNKGYISFARFMQHALYHPIWGYYSRPQEKFGKKGDFTTAPEISPLFAKSIARQCAEVFKNVDSPVILEYGAGSGKFARDVLIELEILGHLPDNYLIFEISPSLTRQQQIFLQIECPHLFSRIIWLDKLPTKINGVIFANEVLDAMPVNLFRITENNILERCVALDENEFIFSQQQPTTPDLIIRINEILQECTFLPSNYESEVNLNLTAWLKDLESILNQGVILLFDYGYGRREYYRPDRNHGTLTCFYKHRKTDTPLVNVGLQDMTAHVDFTALAEAGTARGLQLCGFTSQASFLLACGLLEIAEKINLDMVEHYAQSQAIKLLTLPSEMGELVKVMGFSKNYTEKLIGFGMQNKLREL